MYKYSFGSDNHSGVHPKVLQAINDANTGYCFGYGDDPLTEEIKMRLAALFGGGCEVYLVMTGTGANVISLQALMNSFHSVICAQSSHINVDECGAVQKFTQARLLVIDTPDGKLSPELIEPQMHGRGDQHHSQKRIISVSQSTEYGTLYSISELKALADFAHQHHMFLHIDGARLSNAAAALKQSLRAFTKDVGADIVSFGGTKNGMMFGEAIITYVPELTQDIIYYRKQGSQLYSKMRYISAQYKAYLQDELWMQNALLANEMAQYLAQRLSEYPDVQITQKVWVNSVFVIMPPLVNAVLQEKYMYYTWDETRGEVRLMCSYSTTKSDIDAFVADLELLLHDPHSILKPNDNIL